MIGLVKLAEALIQRADLQKRLAQVQARVLENARVQEGDEPAEDPNRLIEEFKAMVDQLIDLVARINRTNLTVKLADGQTLTDAISKRDGLKLKAGMYRVAADAGVGKQARVTRSEIKFVSMVQVGRLREEADQVSRQFRELDSLIQAANWNNDLLT